MNMKRNGLLVVISLFLVGAFFTPSNAIVLDFQDNVACPPGFYGLAYYNYVDQPKLKDNSGNTVKTATGDDLDLTVHVGSLRPVYYWKGLGTLFAANVIVPFGEASARNFATGRRQSSSGLGDILFGPAVFLYTHEKTGTALSFWEFASAPTGDYSKRRAEEGGPNLGLNYWYLQHQLAFSTVFYDKSPWSFDMNINYYQKFNASQVKPGDSFEPEAIVGYGLTDALRVGVYARYFFDLQKSEYFGAETDKAKIFSAGPSIAYSTPKWGVNFRYIHDFEAKNAPKGSQIWLRANYVF
jgi:hypothetical protein